MEEERRRSDRVPLAGQIQYRRWHLFLYGRVKTAHIVNLSGEGAEIGSFEVLATGTRVQVQIPGRFVQDFKRELYTIGGKVMWWSHGQREKFYRVGIRFVDAPAAYRTAFHLFAQRQGVEVDKGEKDPFRG